MTITLDSESLSRNLSIAECMDEIESLYARESEEIAYQPSRVLSRIDQDSIFLTMPGYSPILERFAVKIISEYKNNPKIAGRRVQGGVVMLFDSRNAELLAYIDSVRLTAIRTGAVSGLATKLLSRTDSKKVSVIGSGDQARTQLEAVCAARNIEEARVFSRDFSHAKDFAAKMSEMLKVQIEAARDKRELCQIREDILIVATNSSNPVLNWTEDISPGMHINSIGALPERQELDLETVANSRLFVDNKQAVLREAGDIINAIKMERIDESHIIGDLSDLVLKKKAGRTNPSDITLFKSVGFALLDVYAANRAYENTRSKNNNYGLM
jgi:alanine dehydrogenase